MTNLGTVILLIVCVGMGYVLEPVFFSSGQATAKQSEGEGTGGDVDNPTGAAPSDNVPGGTEPTPPEPAIQIDLSKLTSEDFPTKVELKVPFTISDANSGVTMKLKKGTKVKPLRLEGSQLVIQPVGLPIESRINVDNTNFKKLALPKMLKRLQNAVAKEDPKPAPPVTPTVPEPTPPAPPEPAPPAQPAKLDVEAIVALLKADVKAGGVTEFKAKQVTSWKAGKEMDFDGETYQTGLVTFKAETILGVQEHAAIALIEDGKVYKWMWAKTKLEMR